jgi:hypothetical protein
MPDLIPQSNSPKVFPPPNIYNSSQEYIGEKQKISETTDEPTVNKTYAINETSGKFTINDNVKVRHSSTNKEDFNNEQKETLKKSDANQKKTYSIDKAAGFVVYDKKKDFVAKSASPSRTSVLSDSIKDSETNSFMPSKSLGSGSEISKTGQKRVIDSPVSLKTSSSKPTTNQTDASSVPRQETSPYEKPSTSQSKLPPSSSPSQANVFMNLFSKFSSKMSGPLLSSSFNNTQDGEQGSSRSKAPVMKSYLIYEISPEKFKDCDHRLKLYFEVSLFTGGSDEVLRCLIKVSL